MTKSERTKREEEARKRRDGYRPTVTYTDEASHFASTGSLFSSSSSDSGSCSSSSSSSDSGSSGGGCD